MLVQNLITASEHLTGFAIVMCALAILWGLTALMGKLVVRFESKVPAKAPVATVPLATSKKDAEGELDGDDLVVIAAAAASMLDSKHRIVSIRPYVSTWGQQGRREIHASHRIR